MPTYPAKLVLSESDRKLVAEFVRALRARSSANARDEFQRLRALWAEKIPDLPPEEAEALVDEAIRFSRGQEP
jgi:hypothetical protein